MKCLSILIAAFLLTPAIGQDPFVDPVVDPAPAPTKECDCETCDCNPCECAAEDADENEEEGDEITNPADIDKTLTQILRPQQYELSRLEARVERLERDFVPRAEIREIAEAVAEETYQRYAKQLSIGIKTASGQTRQETVKFSSPTDTNKIMLAPGETLYSYEDPLTGQQVRVGQPVPNHNFSQPVQAWSGPVVEMRQAVAPLRSRRAVYVRPMVEVYNSNGVTSRGLYRANSGSCRIINGRRVCN